MSIELDGSWPARDIPRTQTLGPTRELREWGTESHSAPTGVWP